MTEASDFWTRRKAAVKAEAKAAKQSEESAKRAEDQAKLEEKSDDEILAELKLPDPDTLEKGDDFSGYLSKAVPLRLQRRALRRLWLTNPVLANLDELLEYGEDYTDAATVVENLQTAYQVGKGMLAHVEKMAETAAQLDDSDSGIEAEDSESDPELTEVADSPEENPHESINEARATESTGSAEPGRNVKRRMRMNFPRETT